MKVTTKIIIILCIISVIIAIAGLVLGELELVDIGARALGLLNILAIIRFLLERRKRR